uniref:HAT C-terminal dimerisation domain-containing protein n=1 Tax=Rhizophagus irregularis (strain DAOM 181602 / DAOM 197198 / MUCL 43194) TaxID=747089 RepID=U9TVA2_RHIID
MEIVANNGNLLANDSIAQIIQSRNFFLNLQILAFVLEPLRKAVLALKARSATLADCFLSLARLAAVLNKLPKLFNSRFYSRFRSAAFKKLRKYKDEEDPFDLDLSIAKQSPLNWWKLIATDPEPELLPKVACHLLSIYPNLDTCERGFSTLGWLFERRLNLKLATLELMYKLITYWKFNSKTELGYYGVDQRKNIRLSDDEINIHIAKAFKETDENDDDDLTSTHKSTDIDVSKDLLDDFDENMNDDNRVSDDAGGGEDDNKDEKGYYNYDVDDLLFSIDEKEED